MAAAALSPAPVDLRSASHDVTPNHYKALYGFFLSRKLLEQDVARIPQEKLAEHLVSKKNTPSDQFPKESETKLVSADKTTLKIGIIGAGIGGLYTAWILGRLGIDFEILEASSRFGGRLLTHRFSEEPHDYYDVGAMRFPYTPIMDRTFQLFKDTGVDKLLIRYIMECKLQPSRYNDITCQTLKHGTEKLVDPFQVSDVHHGPVPIETVRDPAEIMNNAYEPFKRKIKSALEDLWVQPSEDGKQVATKPKPLENPQAINIDKLRRAFTYLFRHDRFSLRDYLAFVEDYDYESIHWLETTGSATNWFDMAFTENVLESLAFEYDAQPKDYQKSPEIFVDDHTETEIKHGIPPVPDHEWYCIDGGTSKLTDGVMALIKKDNPDKLDDAKVLNKRVVKMALEREPEPGISHSIKVHVQDEAEPRTYDTVINSTTFAALQRMDLTDMELSYGVKAAIRSLRYDTSTKIGIKFSAAWWMKDPYDIRGGLGKTDMPIRTCVYPSYNINDDKDKPAVLLCSYTWGQDSERLASLIDNNITTKSDKEKTEQEKKNERDLKDLLIWNLARLHCVSDKDEDIKELEQKIRSKWLEYHAYDWSKDPYTAGGAFALFSPGQFSKFYPHVVRPQSDSRFHIIGEAASVHHAWIVGALDSAVRAVYYTLIKFGLKDEIALLEKEFGKAWEVDYEYSYLNVAVGELKPEDQPKPRF